MEDDIVDLTWPTPETHYLDAPLPATISLLTPETSKRISQETSKTNQTKKKNRTDDDAGHRSNLEGGTTSPIAASLRRYIARRRGLPPSTSQQRHPETDESPPIVKGRRVEVDEGTTSPITDSLRKYIARRQGHPPPPSQPRHPETHGLPSVVNGITSQLPSSHPLQPHQHLELRDIPQDVTRDGTVDATVEVVEDLLLSCIPKSASVPARHLLFAGKDDVVIQLSEDLQRSFVSTALVRMLDELEKDGKQTFTTFICQHHASLLPGRRCITWLKKMKNPTTAATHEHLPYRLLLLEAEEYMTEMESDRMEETIFKVSRSYPSAKLAIWVMGLDHHIRHIKRPISRTKAQLEARMTRLFVTYTGLTFRFLENPVEGAEQLLHLSHALWRMLQNKYDLSFLTIFGGCKTTEAINIVDLKLNIDRNEEQRQARELLEWINVLHAIPGIGPKDAHGIALVYPSFYQLMEIYTSSRSNEEKRLLVADVLQPPENVRRIGNVASGALYHFFCNTHPASHITV